MILSSNEYAKCAHTHTHV